MDFYSFYTGKEFHAHEYLGVHEGSGGMVFRTFAPNAVKVSVIGQFNDWQETPMRKVYDGNFWECVIENAEDGMFYKYRIYKQDGSFIDHCDPYGRFMELRPKNASIIRTKSDFKFKDGKWRKKCGPGKDRPVNLYEVHAGSWRRSSDEEGGWYSYAELAGLLIPYLEENGYNWLELMPLSEHPCDESWGYQNTGFFSPTSRYGTPDELKALIDQCHRHDIGVIMDFVPVHFAVDDYALWNYDGTSLYEYPHSDVGRSEWGSCNFMHSRGEVRSFLQSAAHYWLEEFHFDGLRMDAVSNLLYWQGDTARGQNINGIQFLRDLNKGIKELHPGAVLIAEDSSTYRGVTAPVEEGGLGFDYKWDMGWMNDTLSYFQSPPEKRKQEYHKLTFSMQYFYDEDYLLPLSHDEVVHGKATILQKMYGAYDGKFLQARAFYLYMYAHPGKKLNFMGNEFGQLREWDEKREQDWEILRFPLHDAFWRFMKDLNKLYGSCQALYELDYEREGFAWLDCSQQDRLIYAFERRGKKQRIAAVFNFSDQAQEEYVLHVDGAELSLLIASDMESYGGDKAYEETMLPVTDRQAALSLPPYSGRYYEIMD